MEVGNIKSTKNLLVIAPIFNRNAGAGGLVNFHLVSALSSYFNVCVISVIEKKMVKKQQGSFELINTSPGLLHLMFYSANKIITHLKFMNNKVNGPTPSKKDKSHSFKFNYNKLFLLKKKIFIPDTFVDWLPNGIYSGLKCIKNQKINAIVSSATPYTSHIVAYILSKLFGLPLILFYQDPWVIEKSVKRGKLRFIFERYVERKIVNQAKLLVFCTEATRREYIRLFRLDLGKTAVVYYGFDQDDFDYTLSPDKSAVVNLVYGGRIVIGQRNIIPLFEALCALPDGFPIHIDLFIKEGYLYFKQKIKELNIENFVSVYPPLNHKKFSRKLRLYDYLILLGNVDHLQIPSKLYEYIGSRRPIFLIKNNNSYTDETLKIVESMDNSIVSTNEYGDIKNALYRMVELKRQNKIIETPVDFAWQFSWHKRKEEYLHLFKKLLIRDSS